MDLDIAGSNPVIHPVLKPFAEHILRVPADGRQCGPNFRVKTVSDPFAPDWDPPHMPRLIQKTPSYRLHRSDGRAVVTIDGRDIYLGPHGSVESRRQYDRLISEWLANGRRFMNLEDHAGPHISINEVLLAFWKHAENHYRDADGTLTGELGNYRDSIRPLRRLYGITPARDFGALKLKAVRQAMADANLARTTINQRIGRIVHLFKWAASEELVPVNVYQSLKTVAGLQKGRTSVRETEPVRPVPDEMVDAIRPHVARQIWAMVELQRLTGARPGEVVIMRVCDIDRRSDVWSYIPSRHKTKYRGKSRRIAIGPRAQEVLKSWLRSDPTEFLFSPREAMAEFRTEQRRKRLTPLYPSQNDRKPKANPARTLRDHYSTSTYYHAIGYGCRRAGIASWHPNQLRHTAATRIRKHSDLDSARAVLGHSDLKTTEIYAEFDNVKADDVARAIG